MSFRVLIISLSILLLCCCAGPDERLVHINTLAEESPEAALDSLDSIDVDKLSEFDRHYYDLTKVKACDKAFLALSSDSSIVAAIDYFAEHGADSIYAEALYYGGRVCDELGDKPRALSYFQEALSHLPDSDKSLNLKFRVLSQTGRLLNSLRLYKEAISNIQQSIEIEKKLNDTLHEVYDLQLLGIVASNAEEYEISSKALWESLDGCKDLPENHTAVSHLYLAQLKYRNDEIDSALFYIKGVPEKIDSVSRDAAVSTAAKIYYEADSLDMAYRYAKELIQFEGNTNKHFGYELLLYEDMLKYTPLDSLLIYIDAYSNVLNENMNDNQVEAAIDQNSRYNYEIHVREKLEAEAKNIRLQLGISMIVLLLFVSGFIILLLKNRNKSTLLRLHASLENIRILEELINVQGEEEKNATARLSDGMENAEDLREALKAKLNVINESSNDVCELPVSLVQSEAYRNLQTRISSQLIFKDNDPLWGELEEAIIESYPNFKNNFSKLLGGRYRRSDLQTAILIKCGVAPSDMANLLGRAKNTISTRRESICKRAFGESLGTKFIDGVIRLL